MKTYPEFTVHCKGHKNPGIIWANVSLLEKEGHGFVNLREGMKQSCDTYFYEISRRLGVDRLSAQQINRFRQSFWKFI